MSQFCLDFTEIQEKKRDAAHRLCFARQPDPLTSVRRALSFRGWTRSSLPPAPLPKAMLFYQPLEVEAHRPASSPHALPSQPQSRKRKTKHGRNLPEVKLTLGERSFSLSSTQCPTPCR